MSNAADIFRLNMHQGQVCIDNFDTTGHDFVLRHAWIISISSFDWYMTELISEIGLRLIGRTPPILNSNLRQIEVPLGNILDIENLNPTEKLLFFRQHIFASIQFKSFYRPDKISEALSYIWTCPAKEKWKRILARMKVTGRYDGRTEDNIRQELNLIGDRRDLIAHSMDTSPGALQVNPVRRDDASRVVDFIKDLMEAIEAETENQLA